MPISTYNFKGEIRLEDMVNGNVISIPKEESIKVIRDMLEVMQECNRDD